jgi:hypothetical protein
VNLLSINVYDKNEWVKAWESQFSKLDRNRWRLQVVCNGPRPDSSWIVASNPESDPTMGYKSCLDRVFLTADIENIVSVHAKTVLSNIKCLDSIIDSMNGHDACFLAKEPYAVVVSRNPPVIQWADPWQECLFVFAVKASKWRKLIAEVGGTKTGTEEAMTLSLEKLEFKVKRINRIGNNIFSPTGERGIFGNIATDGTSFNVHGTEDTSPDVSTSEYWNAVGLDQTSQAIRRHDIMNWFGNS